MPLTSAEADQLLADNFASWVRALGLRVIEAGERSALLRLPWSSGLAREGGGLSGQALMAAEDTATVIALSAALDGFGPMTTIQRSTSFQRPVLGTDVLVAARMTKLGRRLAFTEVTLTAEGEQDRAAQASTVCAVPGYQGHTWASFTFTADRRLQRPGAGVRPGDRTLRRRS